VGVDNGRRNGSKLMMMQMNWSFRRVMNDDGRPVSAGLYNRRLLARSLDGLWMGYWVWCCFKIIMVHVRSLCEHVVIGNC
jgi:hypothetical protein